MRRPLLSHSKRSNEVRGPIGRAKAYQQCLGPKHHCSGTKMRVFNIQPQQILAGESTDRGNNVAARTCTLLKFVDGLRALLE